MTLSKYKQKRKFDKTSEPEGRVLKKRDPDAAVGAGRFVIQEHKARNLHWDFRLEMPENFDSGNIVLKSWAVPKGMPEKKGVRRLAIETEDHPVEYVDFEGVIPEGEYGAGEVKIWDKGKYENLESRIKNQEVRELRFELKGKKLKGEYVMVKTKYGKPGTSWLVFRV